MNFSEFSKRLFKKLSGIGNQGDFIGALFHAGGSNYFPLKPSYDTDSYQRKVFRGDSPFNQDMKDSFPRPIDNDGLMDFLQKRVGEKSLSLIMRNFGVPNTEVVHKEFFFKALCTQFQNIVIEASDEVDDIVVSEYLRLLRESGEAIKSDEPYYPGDDFQLIDEASTHRHEVSLHSDFAHQWTIKNTGSVTWADRYLELVNGDNLTIRSSRKIIDIPKLKPGEEVSLSIDLNARGCEGEFEAIWEMKDSEGRSCFTEKKVLKIAVSVGW